MECTVGARLIAECFQMPVGPKKKQQVYKDLKDVVKKTPEIRPLIRRTFAPVPLQVPRPDFSSYLDLGYDVRDTWASIANHPPVINKSVIQKGNVFFALFDLDRLRSSTSKEMAKRNLN